MPSPLVDALGRDVLAAPEMLEPAVLSKRGRSIIDGGGNQTYGPEVREDIEVVSVPISGQDRDLAPEGVRERDMRKFWTTANVSSIHAHEKDGDFILYGGKSWRVYQAQQWDAFSVLSTVATVDYIGDIP